MCYVLYIVLYFTGCESVSGIGIYPKGLFNCVIIQLFLLLVGCWWKPAYSWEMAHICKVSAEVCPTWGITV